MTKEERLLALSGCDDITPLQWDSNHFGLTVGKISRNNSDSEDIGSVLSRARSEGFDLLYWNDPSESDALKSDIESFGGKLVDTKITFAQSLDSLLKRSKMIPVQIPGYQFEFFPMGEPSESMLDLSLIAGTHSRFRTDPKILPSHFQGLYHEWIRKCTRQECANAVCVAKDKWNVVVGMVAIAVHHRAGSIPLVSIDLNHRGVGLGTKLLDLAHQQMVKLGAVRSSVVTQQSNEAAVAFYLKAGYEISDRTRVFHIWFS